jgi:hypothetical protein
MDRFPPWSEASGERVETVDALERLLAQEAELIADKALSGYFQMARRRSIGELQADAAFAAEFAAAREIAFAAILADLVLLAEGTLRYFAGHWRPRLAEALADLYAVAADLAREHAAVAALRARLRQAQKGPPQPHSTVAQTGAAAILAALPAPAAGQDGDAAAFLATLRFHFLSRGEGLGQRLNGDRLVPALVLGAAAARPGA